MRLKQRIKNSDCPIVLPLMESTSILYILKIQHILVMILWNQTTSMKIVGC